MTEFELRQQYNYLYKLKEEIKQAVRNIRVLRYTSSDEELKGFRVHLFEEEWDKLQKLLNTKEDCCYDEFDVVEEQP